MAVSPTGLLIIRAWLEDAPQPLRAHVRFTTDVSMGFEQSVTVANAAAVRAAVDDWLGEMLTCQGTA